jgi:hypothetical protein
LPQVKLDKQPAWLVLWIVFTEHFWENGEPDKQYDI